MADTHQAHHELLVLAHLGSFTLDVELDLTAPWTVIFGPSGSGKSTILRCACGLPIPGPAPRCNFERHNPDGSWTSLAALPAHRRSLAYAPQQSSLFPHMTVRENVSFPYQAFEKGSTPLAEFDLVDQALTLFSLHALADRHPADLSGGERRRAALARAFATPEAKLMLLDEPFGGIDRPLRDTLLPRLKDALAARRVPVLSVTHDVDEALLLDAEVIRLDTGHVLAQGPARDVLATERERLMKLLT